MIIARRSVSLNFGTDAVAQSLRSVIATSAARQDVASATEPSGQAELDLAALYPSLFAPAARTTFLARSAQAVAFRLSVFGSAAAMLALLHH